MTSDDVISEARRWLGTSYMHQGRNRSGVDCIGLVIVVARHLNLIDAKFREPLNYHRLPAHGLLQAEVSRHCEQISEPVAGCILLMRWKRSDDCSHCGIYTGENIIHAYERVGRVVEHGFRAPWPRRLVSSWKLPRVTYV